MNFKFGGYTHADNSVAFRSISKQVVFGQNGRPHTERWNWQIEGKLIGLGSNPQADIWNQYASLVSAYDALSVNTAGFANTGLLINTSQTIGGIVVSQPPSHDGIKGAEGVTYLKYTCAIQADFPIARRGSVLAFSETVSFTDNHGLPIKVERLPLTGPPILQQVSQASWYFATQSGSITTAFTRSEPEDPIWPNLLRTASNSGRQITNHSPVMLRGEQLSYTTNWKYDFIAGDPFFGYPNERG